MGDANAYANKPLPPGYLCFRCGKPGHHIAMCPTHGDPNYDKPKLKKTTGIPKMFLKEVDEKDSGIGTPNGPDSGLMVSHSGKIVVATANDDAWIKLASTARKHGNIGDIHAQIVPASPHLKCNLCLKLVKNPVTTTCCKTTFCDDCIRDHLLESDPQFTCPQCRRDLQMDGLKPAPGIKAEVEKCIREFIASGAGNNNNGDNSAATGSGGQSPAAQGNDSPTPTSDASANTGLRSRAYKIVGNNSSNNGSNSVPLSNGITVGQAIPTISSIPVISSSSGDGQWSARGRNGNVGGGMMQNRNGFHQQHQQQQNRFQGNMMMMNGGGGGGYNNAYGQNFYGGGNQMIYGGMPNGAMDGQNMWIGGGNSMGMMGVPSYRGGGVGNAMFDGSMAKRKRDDDDEKPPGE
ncbi:hypothetical protein HK100_009826 [Physocladia obscura]|uniref:Uncharacterized protein n=1 Tax=Physocladia obscura TaxID=109957 RepID=A0AAD5SN98_9FUNG|nr:hypothetical protein HK100_009826 [Physocladia obscura]